MATAAGRLPSSLRSRPALIDGGLNSFLDVPCTQVAQPAKSAELPGPQSYASPETVRTGCPNLVETGAYQLDFIAGSHVFSKAELLARR